jgi:glycerophosphoryl diester phosphodiesterase
MKIIGHRGAAGIALENTLQSIEAALTAGVDAVEIDVRLTIDGQFVLSHDATLRRVGGHGKLIANETLASLQQLCLRNNQSPPSLDQVLAAMRGTMLLIEAKGHGWAESLSHVLRNATGQPVTVIARDQTELALFHKLVPKVPVYLVQRFNPIDVLQALQVARHYGFTGVDLNFWLLNPLTYWMARRYKLRVIVYSVDHIWIVRFLLRLFPEIAITTNHPQRMQFLRTSAK